MKVAVIFTGFFRTFHYTKQSFKDNIMDPLNPDIFFSSPKTLFTLPQNEDHNIVKRYPFHLANQNLVAPEVIDFFGDNLKSYELIDYNHEPILQSCVEHNIPYYTRDGAVSFRILSQLINKELSVKIFKQYAEKNNSNYDVVIMTRGDLKYYSSVNFDVINLNSIGCENHGTPLPPVIPRWCPPSNRIPQPFNDQITIGSQKNMLVWHNLAQSFFDFWKEGLYFTPENIMSYHLKQNNINLYDAHFINYELWRHEK